MVEAIPCFLKGRFSFYAVSNEFSDVLSCGSRRIVLWVGDVGYDVTEMYPRVELGSFSINFRVWMEPYVPIVARFLDSVDNYIAFLKSVLGDVLRGKVVVVSFSGGKDSLAALVIASKLADEVGFKLKAIYVHMPYLESEKNVDYALEAASKAGVECEVASPPKKVMLRYLLKYGLPYHRARWCTYLKTRPVREFMKRVGADFTVAGDRLFENVKRMSRLLPLIQSRKLVRKRVLYLVAPLTILDVASICRQVFTHPSYLKGLTRVACTYCPYKTAPDILIAEREEPVENPGLIESIMRIEWVKWYSDIPYEDFKRHNLWRYVPKVAKAFNELKRRVEKSCPESIKLSDHINAVRALWTQQLPKAPKLTLNDLTTLQSRVDEVRTKIDALLLTKQSFYKQQHL